MYMQLSFQIYLRWHSTPRSCTFSLWLHASLSIRGLLICDKSKYERSKYISSHVYGTGYRLLPFVITGQLKLIVKDWSKEIWNNCIGFLNVKSNGTKLYYFRDDGWSENRVIVDPLATLYFLIDIDVAPGNAFFNIVPRLIVKVTLSF